jgi:hypothetical protein
MSKISNGLKASWIFIFFLFLPMAGKTQSNCVLKKDKNNIKIYSCPTKESTFNTIRAEFEINTTVEKYISLVLDIENYKNWRYHETNHKLLKRISDNEIIYYNQINAPFPVSDRDMVSHLTISQDPQTKIVTLTTVSMPTYIPPVDGIVRVPKSKSIMILTPISESRLKASCIINVDPGGQIPAWVANTFSTQGPYEAFKKVIEEMEVK